VVESSGGAVPISVADLAVAAALVLVAGAVSLALGLRLERRLAWASLRTVVQLTAIGYVLRWVFDLQSPLAIGALALVMVAAASHAAIGRPKRTFQGAGLLAFATLAVTGLATTCAVTGAILSVEPWYRPQYLIPLLGMILGNGLTGISLCLDDLLEAFSRGADLVEMELSLGATRWEAARQPIAEAVRRGMIPIINSMMVVGIVSLPGMMTGQILSGADPMLAVRYQIVVMFMLAAATSAACILLAVLTAGRCFNSHHQLRRDMIRARGG